jgi:transcription elongation factor GreA
LVDHINRFLRHKEPADALATALVIERVAADGLPVSTDAHGMALKMLAESDAPVAMVTRVPDARLWSLAVACLEQAFPRRWPELFADLILYAPASQCDVLAKKVEKAGAGHLLPSIVQRALADAGRFTDAVMWIWKGPDVQTPLPVPPLLELFNLIMTLVGPTRISEGKVAGQTVNEMRAKVRAGLSAKEYARFRECIDGLDDALAQTVRRLIERGEGLGPSLQEDMSRILRTRFANLYVKPKVAMWDDESVLYFTPKGLKAKEDELAEIVNVKMRENAKAIGEAASHGDLSENSEYKFALEERDLLRARVAKLNRELSLAKVLEKADIPSDHVSIGQRLTIRPVAGGEPTVLTILGFDESDIANHVYSYQSPLARQFLGRKVGDVLNVTLDGGATDYTIDKVESAL